MGSTLSQLAPYTTTIPLAALATFLALILAYSRFTRPVLSQPRVNVTKTRNTSAPIPGAFDASLDAERSPGAKRRARRKRAKASTGRPTEDSPPPSSLEPGQLARAKSKAKAKSNAKATPPLTLTTPILRDETNLESQLPSSAFDGDISSTTAPMTSTRPFRQSTTSIDTDGSWTRVESRSRRSQHLPVSDAATTSTGDEDHVAHDRGVNHGNVSEDQGQKSSPGLGTEDTLSSPPSTTDAHLPSFSSHSEFDSQTGEEDNDGGWGVVKSRSRPQHTHTSTQATAASLTPKQGSSSSSMRAPETLTKRQRQNARQREAKGAAKAEAETQRLLALAQHRAGKSSAATTSRGGSSRVTSKSHSGGMTASVDEHGKLVWI